MQYMESRRSEYLLRQLSKAASLCESDRPAALLLLRDAQAHLWRLCPDLPLTSALELERRLSTPLESWLPESVRLDYTGPLLASDIPTQTCREMLLELDVHQLWEEIQSVVKEVRDLCRVLSNGDVLYRRFRQFLIENPVIETVQAAAALIPLGLKLDAFYEPIPEHLSVDGKLYRCPECRWPMNPSRQEVQCDSAWCREKNSLYRWDNRSLINLVTSQALAGETAGKRYMLKSALWKYTLLPGLLELQLAQQLSEHGLDVTLWPDVDRSDLRVVFGGIDLDIDAKVWISPRSLGRHLESMLPSTLRWIVTPDYQKAHIPWLRSVSPAGLQVFTQSECIKELTQRANPF